MQEYRFNIGEYELSFSVPKAFLEDSLGRPDHYPPQWRKGRSGEGTAADYFFHIHMFNGPIWVGNYASMIFTVREFEADTAYNGRVSTLEELEEYLKWQLAFTRNHQQYEFSNKTVSGYKLLQMALVRKDSDRTQKRDDENTILWLPLDDRRFLHLGCRITELVPGKTDRWLNDAHKMRDLILDSIVLRKETGK